jgi:signal transduction histidine kinase
MLARLDKAFEEQKIFLLDISHELRTPLTALRGNIDVMLMDDSLAPEVREHLERISSEVARLIRLTANLLYVASADVGREPERRPVELDVLCLEVYRQARDLRDDVKLTLGGEDQVIVMGDRDLLKQMVLNLVDNGLKYARSGGHVSLKLARDGNTARIVVADDGPGIAPEALPHIFERFYRGEDRRRKGGTGLGLAIADWVARSHGGRIDVESELGHGSKFTVALPIAQEEPAEGGGKEPARAPEEQPASGGRRVDPELRGLPEG